MKLFKKYYFNLKFKTQLTISYFLLIAILLTILGIGYYKKSSDIILQSTRENILNIIRNSNQTLNTRFNMVEQSAIFMHIDDELFEFFNSDRINNPDYCMENDRNITKIILKYFPKNQDIYSVNLAVKQYTFGENPTLWIPKNYFSQSQVYYAGKNSKNSLSWIPTYNIVKELGVSKEMQAGYESYSQYALSAVRTLNCSIIKNNILINMNKEIERPVLIINFKEDMLKKIFIESTHIEGSYYYILTKEGQVISRSDSAKPISFAGEQWFANSKAKKSGTNIVYVKGEKVLAAFDTIDSTGWISVVFIPYYSLLKTLPNMNYYALLLTLLVMLLSMLIASLISGMITRPIKKLLSAMKDVGEGNFSLKIKEHGSAELSYLIYKFNRMNEKIQKLIEENYQVKIKEREAEIQALNFQFNPHFMYNSLNIINWMAVEQNQEEISKMIINLSFMLEYTAKNDKSKVDFGDDMKYLKNYVYIMMKRFVEKFHVEYEIDSKLYNYDVPKFFLQPFVENTLIHGFEDIEEGGILKISGWIEDNMRYFRIEDNGKGISEEKIKEVLKEKEEPFGKEKSIGIENVNKRIKLLYGSQYGVNIESQTGGGTKVTVVLPLKK